MADTKNHKPAHDAKGSTMTIEKFQEQQVAEAEKTYRELLKVPVDDEDGERIGGVLNRLGLDRRAFRADQALLTHERRLESDLMTDPQITARAAAHSTRIAAKTADARAVLCELLPQLQPHAIGAVYHLMFGHLTLSDERRMECDAIIGAVANLTDSFEYRQQLIRANTETEFALRKLRNENPRVFG